MFWALRNAAVRFSEAHLGHVCRAIALCPTRYLVGALLLLGGTARVRQYLATTSYWHDEAFLLLNVFQKSLWELIGPLSHDQAAPPLFLWMLRACYTAAGSSECVMRLPAVLASIAGLIVMVPLARMVVGSKCWMWAVACSCVSSSLLHLTYQVKPYTTDVVVAEVVLLATAVYILPGASEKRRLASGIGLVLLALFAPWLSFPSVFVLGGACMGLLAVAVRSRRRQAWAYWAGVSGMLVASCVVLWLVAARHHNTPYQQQFWTADFLDLSSLTAAVAWCGRKLVEAGNYGVQGTGIPMALLATIGLLSCWRRQPALAVALVAPALLAGCAAALRHYPLGNRLLAFLLPCLWLCAAQGVDWLSHRLQPRAAWLAVALPVLVLLPGGVRTARYAVFAKPSVEFRQAFEFVHQQLGSGDSLWVSQPEVYEAYFGRRPNLLDSKSSRAAVEQALRRGRIWMVCHPPAAETTLWNAARKQIELFGGVAVDRFRFVHLEVDLFAPQTARVASRLVPGARQFATRRDKQ